MMTQAPMTIGRDQMTQRTVSNEDIRVGDVLADKGKVISVTLYSDREVVTIRFKDGEITELPKDGSSLVERAEINSEEFYSLRGH